jgi:hypothetical protein
MLRSVDLGVAGVVVSVAAEVGTVAIVILERFLKVLLRCTFYVAALYCAAFTSFQISVYLARRGTFCQK